MKGFLLLPYINLSLADDEWETPKEFFDELCDKYSIYPRLKRMVYSKNGNMMYGVIHHTV